MQIESSYKNNICLKIDFQKNSEKPQRVFDSMSLLISSVEEFHESVLHAVDTDIRPFLLLSDINEGSIKSWLTINIDGEIPNEKQSKFIGFMNYCTERLITFIKDKDTITNVDELDPLINELHRKADELRLEEFPNVFDLNRYRLLKSYTSISDASGKLNAHDDIYVLANEHTVKLNKNFKLTKDDIDLLIVDSTRSNITKETLIIKKADFIGNSMWDFIKGKTKISAKMRVPEWLTEFHNRKVLVAPGDGLLCDLVTIVFYDKYDKPVETKYEVVKVHNPVEMRFYKQGNFDYEE
ncbi:hypothetical protein [Aeromonas veronii]|uniref:hypothetical protein n=1 Tax=Aeromonas veronii TaxID=654 RepID=UPI001FD70BDE|nr:hypothetical protein [Aeromonas veronii]MCJ8215567.1 hypothetical protein [Aeromonas veronii]USP59113.1 hypothetical protein J6598_04015 [Aeromonas veronii]